MTDALPQDSLTTLREHHAEVTLRESEAKYRSLFASIDEGCCICEMLFDENGKPQDYRFLEVNLAFEQLTGLQQATGKTARELIPNLEPERLIEAIMSLLGSKA